MEPNSNYPPIAAYSVAILLLLTAFAVLSTYISAASELSVFKAGSVIGSSIWSLISFFDACVGALFAVIYVYLRDGPSVFIIPSRVYAFIWPFFTNFALLSYIAWLIISEKSIVRGLLPHDRQSEATSTVCTRRRSIVIIVLASIACASLLALSIWAGVYGSRDDIRIAMTKKWNTFQYMDQAAGLLFIIVYIFAQQGLSIPSVLWIISLFVFGNVATCVYVILLSVGARRRDIPFAAMLLSKNTSPITEPEQMPLQPGGASA